MSTKPVPLTLIADPVRLRILLRLEREGAASLEELAEAAEVHVNTVRAHIPALEAAGLLVRDHVQTGSRGRPALRYALAPGWRLSAADLTGLTELLAGAIAALEPDPARLNAIGHDWGRWLAGRPGALPLGELVPSTMAALGFTATLTGDTVELSGCPCTTVLPDRPELLCGLAVAVVDGLAAAARERAGVSSSEHDPATRHCALHLTRA